MDAYSTLTFSTFGITYNTTTASSDPCADTEQAPLIAEEISESQILPCRTHQELMSLSRHAI
jgi:hypothetical protein